MESLDALIQLAEQLRARPSLEQLLQVIADRAGQILGVARVSVRLLDPTCTSLLAIARAGEPLHDQPTAFQVGEGLVGWIVEHNEPLRVAQGDTDPRFVPRPGMTERLGGFLGVPIRAGEQCTGVLSAVGPAGCFDASHEQLLTLIAALCGPYVEIARLSRLSRVDPLTGSLNRRGLDEAFPEVGEAAVMSVAMLDIDRFKAINDEHGHAAGDLVLRQVAVVVGNVVRAGDAVVRFGGEEFLLVLPGVAHEAALRICERARAAVEAAQLVVGGVRIAATVSIGVAELRAGETRDAVIARADAALYRAKHAGRNRVELANGR